MSQLDFPAMSAKLVSAELEMVRAFRAASKLHFARERLRLEEAKVEGEDDSTYNDLLAGQYVIAEEILELSEELSIVAAYRVVELNTKRLTRWLDPTYTHFSWPSFAELLHARMKVDIRDLDGASAVDELRLLNNAIKHEAKVTDELAQYPGWTAGARVHPLGQSFKRLAPAVPRFVEALARVILPVKLGGIRPNEDVFTRMSGTA